MPWVGVGWQRHPRLIRPCRRARHASAYVTAEECDLVSGYCSYVKREAKGNDKVLYIEHIVSLEAYVDDMFGSIDAVIVGNDEVHVIDLKTGARSVSAESNPQPMAYLLGAVNAYEMWEAETFKMTIWQGGEADTVTASLSEPMSLPRARWRLRQLPSKRTPHGTPAMTPAATVRRRLSVLRCTSNSLRWWVVTLRILPTRPN